MNTEMSDSLIKRKHEDGTFEADEDETILQMYYNNVDPDLAWIIDAAAADASSNCDHSDHDHVVMQSSTSNSLDDLDMLPDDIANIDVATKNGVNAMQPRRSLSLRDIKQEPTTSVETQSKAIAEIQKKVDASPPASSPPRIMRQQQNQRLKKINGDDTILNLYAVTVAKAVSPPPPSRKQHQASTIITPDVTSPSSKKAHVVFPRSSQLIQPETSAPTKRTTTEPKSSLATISSTSKNPVATLNAKWDSKSKVSEVPTLSLTPKVPSSKSDTLSSPLTKVRSIATGNARMPARIHVEISDHDDEDEILESFSSNMSATGSSSKFRTKNQSVDSSTVSVLVDSPEEKQRQQYLHLEIAKELDDGKNSRRFQLAIQSNVSSLTLGTFADQDINGDDLSVSGATFCDRYSVSPGYNNDDDDETFVDIQPPPPPPLTAASDNEFEVSLEDGTIKAETKNITHQLDQITKSPEEKARKSIPPALLLQKSHSWMRNRLWGQQPLTQLPLDDGHTKNKLDMMEPLPSRSEDVPTSVSQSNDQSVCEKKCEVDCSDSIIVHPPLSSDLRLPTLAIPPENSQSQIESHDTETMDQTRRDKDILFYCIFYLIPFTYQAGTTLPQIYFLIELVDVYDTNLYLAGIYLSISLIMRFAMQSISLQAPRISAIGGTLFSLTGYLILLLINKITGYHSASDANIINVCLFIFGNIIIGSNEVISCVNTVARDMCDKVSTSNSADSDYITLFALGWEAQLKVIQLSTIISFAVGGVIYEFFDITGIAISGITLLGLQLISLFIVLGTEQTKQSISEEFRKLGRCSSSSIPNFFLSDAVDIDVNVSSSPRSDFRLRQGYDSQSFRSMVTPELATIEESPAAESDSEDDACYKINFFEADRHDQLQLKRQSLVSSSSATPEHDNRTSTKQVYSAPYGQNSEQYPSNFYEAMVNNQVQPLQWAEIFVILGVTIQPILNGLVFGVGTLLLFEEFNQDKSIIGYIYAASSICAFISNEIPEFFLNFQYFERFNTFGSIYLFCSTYMILLTAISLLSSYVVGAVLTSLLLGLFARSMNEVQCRLIHSNNKSNERIMPYRKRIRFICSLLATLITPILYDVIPRLPNMVGSGICFAMTIAVWFCNEAANENESDDGEQSKVNLTTDTVLSESNDGLLQREGRDLLGKDRKAMMQQIRLESLIA